MKFDDPKQKEKLEEFYRKEEEDLVKILSERYEIPYIDLSTVSINSDALKTIPEDIAREAGVAVFSITGKKIKMVIISPKKKGFESIVQDLQRKGYVVTYYMASKGSLEKAWEIFQKRSEETRARYQEKLTENHTEAWVSTTLISHTEKH